MGNRRHVAKTKDYRGRRRNGSPIPVGRCADTGKLQYESRKEARAARRTIALRLGDPDLEVYACSYCPYLHLGHGNGHTRAEHREFAAQREEWQANHA